MSIEFNASSPTVVPAVAEQTYDTWTLDRFVLKNGTELIARISNGVEERVIRAEDIFALGQDTAAQNLIDKLSAVVLWIGKQEGILID